MAVQILGDGNTDGTSVSSAATEPCGFHGVASVQAVILATTGSTAASMRTRLNLIRGIMIAKGLCAAS